MSKNITLRVFFDSEFTQLKKNADLISLGMVCGNTQRSFYAEFNDFDITKLDRWLYENVIPNLEAYKLFADNSELKGLSNHENKTGLLGNRKEIAEYANNWLNRTRVDYRSNNHLSVDTQDKITIEMWSDCLAYDWVLFCDLFGCALSDDFPKFINYIPFDICTLFKLKGVDPDINREEFVGASGCEACDGIPRKKHHALWDAAIIKECYKKLIQMKDV